MPTPTLDLPAHPSSTAPSCWFWAGWEPMRHYQRMGKSGSPFFGKGRWLPAWEERKFNGDMVRKARDMGATFLVTEFFKGFGRQLEEETWPKLKNFVAQCHEEGLQVLGYAQARSIYYETFGREVENWRAWAAKNRDGSEQFFGNTYYRCAPCLNSEEYAAYLGKVIADGVAAIGWDGIHLDNAYYQHCWCPRCKELFLQNLEAREDLEARLGIPFSRFIEPPPLPGASTVGLDPLQILWMEFGVETRLRFFQKLRSDLQARFPALIVAGNPAFPRGDRSMISQCLDPSREASALDYLCCENGNLPRMEGAWVASQAEAHLLAEAGHYKIWITAWRATPNGVEMPSAPGGVWASLAEEYTFGSILGNNWALRPSGQAGLFQTECDPARTEAFGEALEFFRKLDPQIKAAGRETWAEVAVLSDARSSALFGNQEVKLGHALQQYLLRQGIPFRLVFSGDALPVETRHLVVFHVGAISDTTRDWISAFAARPGGQVWLAGHSGQTDEWFVPREASELEQFRQSPGIVFTEGFSPLWQEALDHPLLKSGPGHGYFDTVKAGDPTAADAIFEQYFQSPSWQPRMRFSRPLSVLVHTQKCPDGRLLVHFRDQSGGGELHQNIMVHAAATEFTKHPAHWFSPTGSGALLPRSESNREAVWEMPEFRYYGLLVFDPC